MLVALTFQDRFLNVLTADSENTATVLGCASGTWSNDERCERCWEDFLKMKQLLAPVGIQPEIDKKTCQKKNASLRVWFVAMCSGSFGVSWYSMQTWSWKQKEIMDWNLTGSVFQCMVDHLDDTKRWQVDASEVFVNFPYLQSCKVVLVLQLFHGFPMFLFVHRLMHVDHVVYTNQTANIGEWGFIYLQYPSMINLT